MPSSPFSRRRLGRSLALAAALVLALPQSPGAHEVPANVTVLAFVKPDGDRLRLLVRVPLEAIRDIEFPLRGPGYLELGRTDEFLHDAATIWIAGYVALHEDGAALTGERIVATRLSLPSDRSFVEYETALAHVEGPPLPEHTDLPWQQAMLDVLIEYPIADQDARFSIEPAWAHLGIRTTTVLRFLPPSGTERVLRYDGDPGLVRLDPRWHQSAFRFAALGFEHILDGLDHLLFVFLLVIPFRRLRPLIVIVTSFTVAHSITLMAAAFGLAPSALWFPPLIEVLIALSIVWMALENIVGPKLERRWLIAFGFGLVHGFGFSFLLGESLQFAGSHLMTSLLAFNVGVELGQILVILLAIPMLNFLFRRVVAERIGTIILSALVAHTAWHWMGERWAELREYRFEWPAFDLALLAGAMRWAMLLIVLGTAVWLLYRLVERLAARPPSPAAEHAGGES
ncbi:MAG TPA: HupE/UreJ family protein [Gemmatimonadaceae bacterium]|nr:HupE/UreJ family protein [Gemmatimonadaceae bacterium]